jgi:alpha-glucosidase
MELKKVIFAFRGIGIRNILRTIQYSFRRDNAEKKYSPHSISSSEVSPGEFRNIKPIFSGTKIEFEHASVEAQFLSPNLLKISWEPGEPPLPFTIEKFDWENQHPILRYREAVWTLSTDQMMLKIHKRWRNRVPRSSQ